MTSSPKFPTEPRKVLVFGAGNFGSCLADHLGDSAHEVLMWSRSEKLVTHFNAHRRNPEVLQDHVFSESIRAIGPEFPSPEIVQAMDVLLFAIPTQGIRSILFCSSKVAPEYASFTKGDSRVAKTYVEHAGPAAVHFRQQRH